MQRTPVITMDPTVTIPASIYGPAPKEEGMEPSMPVLDDSLLSIDEQEENARIERKQAKKRRRRARAVYREAYFAVLGGMPRVGMESNIGFSGLIKEAHGYAIETVRQWPTMMAELDKLIEEME